MVETVERIDVVDAANVVVEEYIKRTIAPIIGRAEDKVSHTDRGCYCKSCLRVVAEKANDAMMLLIGKEDTWRPTKDEFKNIKDYLYFVVPGRKKGFDLVHGWDLDARNYDEWWDKVARDNNTLDNPNGLSPFGNI